MAISLRLDRQLEKRLEQACRLAGISKSEYVRRCLEKELEAADHRPSPYELAKDFIPKEGSGKGDLARNAEKYLREIIREKARRRRYGSAGGNVRSE